MSTSASIDLEATTVFEAYTPPLTPVSGSSSIGPGFAVYGSTSGLLTKVTYANGSFGLASSIALTGENLTAPIIGASGLIYSLSKNGSFAVVKSADLSLAWSSTDLFSSITGVGQPALDVHRIAGNRTCDGLGVFYVSTANGSSNFLTAILVDSQGLEPTAPWPKYQRDNANTGNISRSLEPWTCP